jgi:hypothetical protein
MVGVASGLGGSTANAEPESVGVEVAAGAGVTVPFGALTSQSTVAGLGYAFAPGVPLSVDAGLHIGRVYFGTAFQYSLLFGCCGANDLQLTAEGRYYLNPEARWAPWVGVGFGIEIANASGYQYEGYSVGARVGVDFRSTPADSLRFGPFASASFGEFTCESDQPGSCGLHAWATIGLRGVWDAVR